METNKSSYLHFIRLSLIFIFTFITFIIIGTHSSYLIKKPILIGMLILLLVYIFFFIYLVVRFFKYNSIQKQTKFGKFLNGVTLLYVISIIPFVTVLYGPNPTFKNWLVTTAMRTMNHKYIAQIFYGENEINETMDNNQVIETGEETDTSLIYVESDIQTEEITIKNVKRTYKNEYDRAVLEHEADQKYKMIRFTVNGQDAYLAVVYDPSMLHVTFSSQIGDRGEYVTSMAKRTNALVAVNGGGFEDVNQVGTGGIPVGVSISNGEIVSDSQYIPGQGLIGFNEDNVLVLYHDKTAQEAIDLGVRDGVSNGPFLIVNGQPAEIRGNGGWGYAARTAIGQRADGIILLLVVDSNETRTNGASMADLTQIMQNYGAVNAANLDGGTSAVMVEQGNLISDPISSNLVHRTRPVVDAITVY